MPSTANTFDPVAHPQVAAVIGPARDRWPKGHEKHRTTRLDGLRYRGVWLRSRYAKGHELATMMAALDHLAARAPDIILKLIVELDCDSKATATYGALIPSMHENVAVGVAEQLSRAFVATSGGHNGVYVDGAGVSATEPPRWDEPEDDGAA